MNLATMDGPIVAESTPRQSTEEMERVENVRQRVMWMATSKSVVENKWGVIKQLYEVYESQLSMGEVWNNPYRFAELFGAVQRKYADLLDNLPEAKVRATRVSAQDFAIAQQATLDHAERMSNALREKSRAIWDSVLYGQGVLFEGYTRVQRKITPTNDTLELKKGKQEFRTIYDGMCSERVDCRDFFVDETATVFYDEAGLNGARDCARRRVYPYSTFMEKFKGFKNIDAIVPTSWGSDTMTFGKTPYEKEAQEQKTTQKYVTVIEYWNIELDMLQLSAGNVEIYYGANPFKHKRLPFVMYYNYRRDDSVWGISEAEILAPFIYSKEEIRNLMILDAKLALQPAIAVSGDVMFNSEENELQPGAIFTLRGLNGGKVMDAIAPLRFGGIPAEAFQLLEKIEDEQIIITGDDIRALYTNPDQLATQTLSKREVAQKRLRSNILQNSTDSEKQRMQLRMSNIVQFYAKPYQSIEGVVTFRRVKVEGYEVIQQGDETKPQFKQQYGAQGYFTLNEDAIGDGTNVELEVIDAKMDDDLKKEQLDDMMNFLQQVVAIVPVQPQIIQGMDIKSLFKQIAKKMDLDYNELFPQPGGEEGTDAIDLELDLVMLGITPEIDPSADPMKVLERYMTFMQTDAYEHADKKAKDALQQLIILTSQNVQTYLEAKLQEKRALNAATVPGLAGQGTMGAPVGAPEQAGGTGAPSPDQVPMADSGRAQFGTPVPRGVAKRFGTNKL